MRGSYSRPGHLHQVQFFVTSNYLSLTPPSSSYPFRLPISPALCVSATSLCLGIRSKLLTLTFRASHNRTPNHLSRSSKTGFFTILIYVLYCPPLSYFMLFPLMTTPTLEFLSKLWPLNKVHLKYPPCPRNPFKFFHLHSIISPGKSLEHFYFHLPFQVYQIILEL